MVYAHYLSLETFQYTLAVEEYTKHEILSNIDAMNVKRLIGKLMSLNADRSLFTLIPIIEYLVQHKPYVSDETCPLVLIYHKYKFMPFI